MITLFNNFIFEPLLDLLVWIYQTISFSDLGVAIIILTLLVRVILLPFFYKSSKDQALIRKLQPKVTEIKNKHKEDREKQAKELMALYKEHQLNPFSGLLILIIQLPIFFGLFKIFKNPELIIETFNHTNFLNLVDLTEVSILLVVIAAVIQYFQGKVTLATSKAAKDKNNPMAKMGSAMIYFGPIMSFIILTQLPSALAVYWITSALFSTAQQFVINKKIDDIDINKKISIKEEDKENK